MIVKPSKFESLSSDMALRAIASVRGRFFASCSTSEALTESLAISYCQVMMGGRLRRL